MVLRMIRYEPAHSDFDLRKTAGELPIRAEQTEGAREHEPRAQRDGMPPAMHGLDVAPRLHVEANIPALDDPTRRHQFASTISTRRFCARPDSVVLSATGSFWPLPSTVMRTSGKSAGACAASQDFTDCAR